MPPDPSYDLKTPRNEEISISTFQIYIVLWVADQYEKSYSLAKMTTKTENPASEPDPRRGYTPEVQRLFKQLQAPGLIVRIFSYLQNYYFFIKFLNYIKLM